MQSNIKKLVDQILNESNFDYEKTDILEIFQENLTRPPSFKERVEAQELSEGNLLFKKMKAFIKETKI
jgi:hypothetical protein